MEAAGESLLSSIDELLTQVMASPRAFHYWKHEAAEQCVSPEPFQLASANNAATTAQSGRLWNRPLQLTLKGSNRSDRVFAYHRIMLLEC